MTPIEDPIEMQGHYTIEDIAKRAHVSRGTVSRVLNDHPSVSDETRAKVLRVIKQLNYRPSYSARQMRTDTSKIVGFVTDEVVTTPYAVDIIRGAQDALRERGKIMMIVSAGYGLDDTKTSIETLLERRVEGILYAAMFHHAVEIPEVNMDIPLILVNCYAAGGNYTSVVPDEIAGGFAAIHHLLSCGHRRIGFINLSDPGDGKPPPVAAAKGRLEGYRRALDQFGVPFDASLVRYAAQTTKENIEITLDLMRVDNPPEAIFCATDFISMGCYAALNMLNLRIPADVAVVGFDDRREIVLGLWPSLTSVALPHYEMGYWAVEYLYAGQGQERSPIQHKINCPLVPRQSA